MTKVINHESVKTDCRHKWVDVGPQFGSYPTACSQSEICAKCGMDAITKWNDQNDVPPIRRAK